MKLCSLSILLLEDAKKDATVESVQSIIAADGEVGKVDVWGMRKLAYPIDKKEEGYYAVVEFQETLHCLRSLTEGSRFPTM